jgi:hypothetical protein
MPSIVRFGVGDGGDECGVRLAGVLALRRGAAVVRLQLGDDAVRVGPCESLCPPKTPFYLPQLKLRTAMGTFSATISALRSLLLTLRTEDLAFHG